MLIKQSSIYAAAGAVIAICTVVLLNINQGERISAERYQRDLGQMTTRINSLTDSISSLTKLTLQLDKSFKQGKAEQISKTSTLNAEPLTQGNSPVKNDPVNSDPVNDIPASDSLVNDSRLNDNFLNPALFNNADNDGALVADEWQIKQQENELVSSFENHFSNQATDTIWAQSTEQVLQNALGSDIFSNSQLNNISCRATLCKIDTQHSDLDSELVFLQQINSRAGFSDTESFYTRDVKTDGNVVMTLYLSRDGHRLPRFSTTGEIASG